MRLGWNTYNSYKGNINQSIIMQTADERVNRGLLNASYTYIVIDDP